MKTLVLKLEQVILNRRIETFNQTMYILTKFESVELEKDMPIKGGMAFRR